MKPKIIGINGSPRTCSNTEYFTQYTLDKIQSGGDIETELINIRDKNIQPCNGCYKCTKTAECALVDDFEEVFNKMREADGIILGSPVYHGAVTPQLKALLDRAGFLSRWVANKMQSEYKFTSSVFSGKVAAPITVARRAGYMTAFSELLLWYTVNDFIVVGSGYWTMGIAGKGGAVNAEEDTEGLTALEHMADNMVHVVKQLKK